MAKFNLNKLLANPAAKAEPELPAARTIEEYEVRAFLHALLFETGFNITEAYLKIRPQVTRKTAATEGSSLVRRDDAQRLWREIAAAAWQRQEVDRDYVLGCWVALSRANIYDYFDQDAAGQLVLRKKSDLRVEIQRNVKKLKVTTSTFAGVTTQRVELELHDRQHALDSLARAGGMFNDLGEDGADGVAEAIERGFARVARAAAGRTPLQGQTIQEGVIIGEGAPANR